MEIPEYQVIGMILNVDGKLYYLKTLKINKNEMEVVTRNNMTLKINLD